MIVFVSGALTTGAIKSDGAFHAYRYECNVREAEHTALECWSLGHQAICVHSLSRFMFGTLPEQTWLEGDLAILRRCDGVVLAGGIDALTSSGTRREVREAIANELPVFFSPRDIPHNPAPIVILESYLRHAEGGIP